MSKEYFCKDCLENNNGWCNKRKFNGLKKITECEFKTTEEIVIDEPVEVNNEPYKQFGKRENFYNIQMQLLAINKQCNTYEEKWNAIIGAMKTIGRTLEFNEKIYGIATDYLIDEDIVNGSKNINNNWNELME